MIRKYKASDEDQIIHVWHKSSDLAHPFLTEEFQKLEKINIREIYLPQTKTWVFEEDENIIGFISMLGNELGAIFVLPEYIGKGIGSELFLHVREVYGDLTVRVFEKNNIGRKFYDKKGFKLIREENHEETGETILFMKLDAN